MVGLMTKKIPPITVPFDDGKFVVYPEIWRHKNLEMKPNFTFNATMEFKGFIRGRSAARFWLVDMQTLDRYEMFLSEFNDMMQQTTIEEGVVDGEWTFCKKGKNYSIRWLGEKT